jgi:hypothetical protein
VIQFPRGGASIQQMRRRLLERRSATAAADRRREAIETLEWMLAQAREDRLSDFVGIFSDQHGKVHHAITGAYRANLSRALLAVLRLEHMIIDGDEAG